MRKHAKGVRKLSRTSLRLATELSLSYAPEGEGFGKGDDHNKRQEWTLWMSFAAYALACCVEGCKSEMAEQSKAMLARC